jgi:hypothetical protein
LELHVLDGGTGVVERHSIVAVAGEREMRVTEVAVVDFLPPFRQNMIQMVSHPENRAPLRKPPVVDLP